MADTSWPFSSKAAACDAPIARARRNAPPAEGGRPNFTSVKPSLKFFPAIAMRRWQAKASSNAAPCASRLITAMKGLGDVSMRESTAFRRSTSASRLSSASPRSGDAASSSQARSRPPTNWLPVPVSSAPLMAGVTITRSTAASRSRTVPGRSVLAAACSCQYNEATPSPSTSKRIAEDISDSQIGAAHHVVLAQFGGRSLQHNLAVLDHICVLREAEHKGRVLFDQQDGNAGGVDLTDHLT